MAQNIQILKCGITDILADCVVNAANEGLWEGSGVCGAIFEAAGSAELTAACQKIGHCDTGHAVITPAFAMQAKYIIHAVGPRYRDGQHGEPEQLYGCYMESLELAKRHGCHSIAFPVISSGIFGYPKDAAWRKALEACIHFGNQNSGYQMEIIFAVPDPIMRKLGMENLKWMLEEEKKDDNMTENLTPREKRRLVFEDTMHWVQENPKLKASVSDSIRNSKIWYEDDYPVFQRSTVQTVVTVSQNRSFEAAKLLHEKYPNAKIAVMNFANAFHPGGGVATGASAQEECLCRCSTLYPVLVTQRGYYDFHKKKNNPKASDALIYSEDITVCKSDIDFPERLPESEWFQVDVMTIAAPDLRTKHNMHAALVGDGTGMQAGELYGYHVRRAMHLLTVAAKNGAEVLVLGAFGCGAFQNDPEVVAKAWNTALEMFPKVFSAVEFAVYSKGNSNYDIFSRIVCSFPSYSISSLSFPDK